MNYILDERYVLQESEAVSTDWAAEYSKCKDAEDFEIFWNGGSKDPQDASKQGYFKTVWGDNAVKVKSLGSVFLNSLVDLGWTALDNPYIVFIEYMISNKIELPSQLSMLTIQKAIETNLLTELDLRVKGKLGKYNLIFNPYFNRVDQANQESYLKSQKTFVNNINSENLGLAFANVYSADIAEPGDKPTTFAVEAGQALRDAKKVSRIVARLTGTDAGIDATDKSVQMILNAIKDAATAKKVLTFLYDVYGVFSEKTVAKANKVTSDFIINTKNTTSTSATDVVQIKKTLRLPSTTYKEEQLFNLFIGISEIAGWKKPAN